MDQSSNVQWHLGEKELAEVNTLYASLGSRDRISTDDKQARRLISSGKLRSHEEAFDILLHKSKCDKLVSRRTDQLIDSYKSLIRYLEVVIPNSEPQRHRPMNADDIKALLNDHSIHLFIETRDVFTINASRSEWNSNVRMLLEQSSRALRNVNGAIGDAAKEAALKQAEAQAAVACNIVKSTVTMLMRTKPPKFSQSSVEKSMKSIWDLSLTFDKMRGRKSGPVLRLFGFDNFDTPLNVIKNADNSFRPVDDMKRKGSKRQKQPP